MMRVKICGLTRAEDVEAAVALGADALGFVLWPGSPRHVTDTEVAALIRDLPVLLTTIGVLVNPSAADVLAAADTGLRVAQIHGAVPEVGGSPIPVLRAVHLGAGGEGSIDPEVDDRTVLLDANDPVRHGGTGKTIDWTRAHAVARSRRVILAGGLTPGNVREAIHAVRPYAVDVSSGVEARLGVKDHDLLRRFIATAKETV